VNRKTAWIGCFVFQKRGKEMKDTKREDMDLFYGGHYTRKYMENGEIRTRLVLPDGTRLSYTEMCDYGAFSGNLPWQEAHLHKGLTEQYTLVDGWAYFIFEHDAAATSFCTKVGQTIQFAPGVPHMVVLGPKAKLITQLFGTPVPNPERKDSDWWPADSTFLRRATLAQRLFEEDLSRD
jgi:hypothetical protein